MNKLTTFINNNYIFLTCVVILGMLFFLTSSTFPYFGDDIYIPTDFFGWIFYEGNPRIAWNLVKNIIKFKTFSSIMLTLIILLNCYLIFFYSFSRNIFNSTTKVKDTIYYVLIFLLYLKCGTWEANLWLAAAYIHTGSVLIILGCFIPFYYLLQGKDVFLNRYGMILLMLLSVYPLGFSSYTSVPLWLIASSLSALFYIYRYKKIPFIHIFYIILTLVSYSLMMFVFKLNELGHKNITLESWNVFYRNIFFYIGNPFLYIIFFIGLSTLIYVIYLFIKTKNIKSIVLNNNCILLKSCLMFLLFLFGLIMFIKADYFTTRQLIFILSLWCISATMLVSFIDVSLSNKYKKIFLYPAFLIVFVILFVNFYDNYIVRSVVMKSAYENYFVKIQEQAKNLTENDVIYVDTVQPFNTSNVYTKKYRRNMWVWPKNEDTLVYYRKFLKIKPQLQMKENK